MGPPLGSLRNHALILSFLTMCRGPCHGGGGGCAPRLLLRLQQESFTFFKSVLLVLVQHKILFEEFYCKRKKIDYCFQNLSQSVVSLWMSWCHSGSVLVITKFHQVKLNEWNLTQNKALWFSPKVRLIFSTWRIGTIKLLTGIVFKIFSKHTTWDI